jgi:peroxiredoxin
MSKLWFITVPASLLIVGAGIYVSRLQPPAISNAPNLLTEPRHPVTDEMVEDAESQRLKPAPDFELTNTHGEAVSLDSLLEHGPVILVTTKDECPCSIEAQPFFNELHNRFSDSATFVGVIDSDRDQALYYHKSLGFPFDLLADPEMNTLKAYSAPQSVYVYFIDQEKQIAKVWPGYNRAMLIELNEMLASHAGVESKPMELTMAPTEMSSGCFFFKEDKWVGSPDAS